ncbi:MULTISPECIES: phosphatase PAP2 family protein [Amycolatopsis]|uniref:Undecaprenyl-diphosphatase n=2 Tax=Amycolatopsis TaxID=1813 RepID=A0A1I4BML8_9PSEU|nr:phosphatase PAP2 family protein [Amycolatopsis sacchari]SFK70074.1 undecaprenyl-diphosphatase [Amycolatopsis sacchari]
MDGGVIDGGWYLDVAGFARSTPWLHGFFEVYTNAGLVLLAVLVAAMWWRARGRPAEAMAAALWVPLGVLLAYGLSNLVKVLVREPRPCLRYPGTPTVAPCDFATDYSFPSNHVVLAVSAAVGLLLVAWRVGLLAFVLAALVGFSRVYVGAHYPHDVLAGAVLGAAVAACGLVARRPLAALVRRGREGRLSPLVGTGAQVLALKGRWRSA